MLQVNNGYTFVVPKVQIQERSIANVFLVNELFLGMFDLRHLKTRKSTYRSHQILITLTFHFLSLIFTILENLITMNFKLRIFRPNSESQNSVSYYLMDLWLRFVQRPKNSMLQQCYYLVIGVISRKNKEGVKCQEKIWTAKSSQPLNLVSEGFTFHAAIMRNKES